MTEKIRIQISMNCPSGSNFTPWRGLEQIMLYECYAADFADNVMQYAKDLANKWSEMRDD